MAVQPCLCQTWSDTPDRSSHHEAYTIQAGNKVICVVKSVPIRALDKPAYRVNYKNIRQDTCFIIILLRIMYENHNQHYPFNIISKRNSPENVLFSLLFTQYENGKRNPKNVWVCSFTKKGSSHG